MVCNSTEAVFRLGSIRGIGTARMIRLEWYIRHRSEAGKEAFQRAWGESCSSVTRVWEGTKRERLVQLSLVETSANLGLTEARGGDMEAFFDGIIEFGGPLDKRWRRRFRRMMCKRLSRK